MRRLLAALWLLVSPAYADAPNIQGFIDQAWATKQAEVDAATAALADYKAYVVGKLGPLWDEDWHKQDYRGFDLDYTGYVETFRSDFDDLSEIGPKNNPNFKWSSGGPHVYTANAYTDDIVANPQLYRIDTPGVLTLRAMTPDGNVATSWRAGLIQTMKADGSGFAQSKGIFEYRVKHPAAPAVGYYGACWLLSAADWRPDITDRLIEIDAFEVYGAKPTTAAPNAQPDKGVHTTVHVKPRAIPLPGEYPTRVSKALYSDPQTVFNTDPATGGASTAHTFPASMALFDGQWHTYTTEITDDWLTMYLDGKSLGRFSNKDGYWSTPLYFIVNVTLSRTAGNVGLVSPIDMQVDYVRAMAK